VTDVALQARLTTGIAPDNQISVAPGYSSKFTSYTTWLDTRQAAITKLTDAVTATQLRLIALEPRLPAAKLKETTGDAKVEAATEERRVKNVAHARASGQQGMGSPEQIAAAGELETATSSLVKVTKARAATAADVDQMLTKLPLPVERSQVDLANIGSFRVKRAYRVIVDNAKAIGSGWKGTDVQAPASITHGGRTVDDAVLYTDTQATEPLTKSLTTLDGGAAAGTPLLTGANPAVPNVALNVAAWDVVQHFPAPPDAVASIE
jgi:hypothetical protein